MWARIAQSAYRLATGWMVQGSNPGGVRFSALIQASHRAHPPIQWVLGLPRGVMRPGRGIDHPPPYSAEVKEYSYTSSPPLGLCGLLQGELYLFHIL